ncbi:hypothetical protein [Xenorhabdus bovienii]|uniref:hypothetical protein n=1 Tax=Xenorhabdus bovienii TaxID=40576 RepID=UPI0023B2B489|nr:hypothetical protein [Xenorhabdus bovienii]MDE9455930.1 hypothetical protein [Xenorhabdus bovienii]
MDKYYQLIQERVNNFHQKMEEFTKKVGIKMIATEHKSSEGRTWYSYSLILREDLYPYELELSDMQRILSYCTEFKDEVVGEKRNAFNGGQRLVLFPENLDEFKPPKDAWFFISHDSEIERFFGYLMMFKTHAKNFPY